MAKKHNGKDLENFLTEMRGEPFEKRAERLGDAIDEVGKRENLSCLFLISDYSDIKNLNNAMGMTVHGSSLDENRTMLEMLFNLFTAGIDLLSNDIVPIQIRLDIIADLKKAITKIEDKLLTTDQKNDVTE